MASVQLSINNATQNQIKILDNRQVPWLHYVLRMISRDFLRQIISLYFLTFRALLNTNIDETINFTQFVRCLYYRNITSTSLCNVTHSVYIHVVYTYTLCYSAIYCICSIIAMYCTQTFWYDLFSQIYRHSKLFNIIKI